MSFAVVVDGVDIDDGMDEAQEEPFGGAVDRNIHDDVVLVQGDLVHIRERCGSTMETQFPADARKA